MRPKVLHVTNWYPNPWDDVEGNFVRAQFEVFREVTAAFLVCVQVRETSETWFGIRSMDLGENQKGYFVLTRIKQERIKTLLTTMLLIMVLLRHRAWKHDLLHFHIAWPLLAHVHLWRILFRTPIIISEHWSAYHYNFHLPEGSPALNRMRKPFYHGFPVIAVSQALLEDIRKFAQRSDFPGYVIPNVVPLHGVSEKTNPVPVLFAVSRWVKIKDPLPMIGGMVDALDANTKVQLVIGGYGTELEAMRALVSASGQDENIGFPGKLSKEGIAGWLSRADGYVFSSQYETFSVACAEALGAGVPLLGPHISAISEYASGKDWQTVEGRDRNAWKMAVLKFVERLKEGEFDPVAIASRAERRFSTGNMIENYQVAISQTLGQRTQSGNPRANGLK